MRTYITILLAAISISIVTLSGCKKKEEDKAQTEEEVRSKVEAAAMNYARTDDALGAYDSIKFVGYTPYFKSTYCDLMCQLLSIQRDELQPKLDSAIENRDNDALVQLSEKMDKIQNSIDYFNKQSYNSLSTKIDPVVLYEAKCYSYTDGYIEEFVYFVTKDWKVIDLNPYDLKYLDRF
ncbi:MAG: hypothetical protein J6X65_00765 [Bacteroidales bacterium]|nr:hypothetical protein [Bacteroidales bacterium]